MTIMCRIPIWSTDTSTLRPPQIGCGWPTLPMCRPGRGLSTSHSSSTPAVAASGLAGRPIDDHRPRSRRHRACLVRPRPERHHPLARLIAHSDADSQHTSVAFTERTRRWSRRARCPMQSPTEPTEAPHRRRWVVQERTHPSERPPGVTYQVELTTAEWVVWFNTERPPTNTSPTSPPPKPPRRSTTITEPPPHQEQGDQREQSRPQRDGSSGDRMFKS